MGSQSKKQQEEQLRREYLQKRRREEEEKQRKQNRIFWSTVVSVLLVVLIGVGIALALTLGKKNEEETPGEEQGNAVAMEDLDMTPVSELSAFTDSAEATDYVKLNVTYEDGDGNEQTGDIVLRLYPEVAPKTVENFRNLVGSGFYDGLTFHRVMEDFMIQGGDPEGNGTGDSGTTIKGEFTANGFTNRLKHVRGVLSMARGSYSMDSASCQFFICQVDYPSLNGQYASFGYVVYGMDTVDGIAGTEVYQPAGSREKSTPVVPPVINKASFVTLTKE